MGIYDLYLDGELIYDIGQNISGVIVFSVNGTKGQEIVIRHSEALDGDNLYMQNLRSAKQEIHYIAKDGKQFYEPRFTYMGFRYIGIKGIEANDIKLKAMSLYSDLDVIGNFSCSDELLNKLQKNLVWSGKDNFVDIPTDCPQRDDGSIRESSMNHYAYGAVGDFFYRRICGLEPLSPGYERFQVKPMVGKKLTFAACTHESPYGKIDVKWEQKEDLYISVTVPVGTICDVVFPNGKKKTLSNGKYQILQNRI